jgi:hypothetical protein
MTEIELLRSAVHEYRGLLASTEVNGIKKGDIDVLVERLSRSRGWTDEGARLIVTLANEYGAFMLRNALAFAIALNKEDGDRGF